MERKEKKIKRVLMCEPLFYEVSYRINPWMKLGSVDKKEAGKQWEKLKNVYEKLGIKVEVIPQKEGLPDMVFSADQGIVLGNEVLLSNFRYPQRRKESYYYRQWFEKEKFIVKTMPKRIWFEGGGDSLWLGGRLLVGVGFRTQFESIKEINKFVSNKRKENPIVIPLFLTDPFLFHLDACLLILNEQSAFYYPKGFSEKSKKILKKLVPNLIPLAKEEAYNFAANSFVINHYLICQKGSSQMRKEAEHLGFQVIELDMGEFMKAGGGIHCLTGELNKEANTLPESRV